MYIAHATHAHRRPRAAGRLWYDREREIERFTVGERRVDVVGALEVLADPPEWLGVLVRPTAPTTSRMAHARGLMGGSRIAPQRSMYPFLTVMGRDVVTEARDGSAGAPARHGRSHRCQARLLAASHAFSSAGSASAAPLRAPGSRPPRRHRLLRGERGGVRSCRAAWRGTDPPRGCYQLLSMGAGCYQWARRVG